MKSDKIIKRLEQRLVDFHDDQVTAAVAMNVAVTATQIESAYDPRKIVW